MERWFHRFVFIVGVLSIWSGRGAWDLDRGRHGVVNLGNRVVELLSTIRRRHVAI